MKRTCKVYDMTDAGKPAGTYEVNTFCRPWTPVEGSLKAFKGDLTDTIVEYDLTYAVFFDTNGYVEFKYRKDGNLG
jgi:hypothetical protein